MEAAYCLGFTLSAIEILEYKYTNYCVQSCEQLFRDWLGSSHGIVPKTWGMLLEKFKEIDELAAATCDIEEELGGFFCQMNCCILCSYYTTVLHLHSS